MIPHDNYDVFTWIPGTHSYKNTIDYNVWSHCYIEHAQNANPIEFKAAADAILQQQFGMQRSDIRLANAESIYRHLIGIF